MDVKTIFDILLNSINVETVSIMLNAILLTVFYFLSKKQSLLTLVKEKMLAVQKVIKKEMYSSKEEYNQVKEDMVVGLIKIINPKIPESLIRSIIKAVCKRAKDDISEVEKLGGFKR